MFSSTFNGTDIFFQILYKCNNINDIVNTVMCNKTIYNNMKNYKKTFYKNNKNLEKQLYNKINFLNKEISIFDKKDIKSYYNTLCKIKNILNWIPYNDNNVLNQLQKNFILNLDNLIYNIENDEPVIIINVRYFNSKIINVLFFSYYNLDLYNNSDFFYLLYLKISKVINTTSGITNTTSGVTNTVTNTGNVSNIKSIYSIVSSTKIMNMDNYMTIIYHHLQNIKISDVKLYKKIVHNSIKFGSSNVYHKELFSVFNTVDKTIFKDELMKIFYKNEMINHWNNTGNNYINTGNNTGNNYINTGNNTGYNNTGINTTGINTTGINTTDNHVHHSVLYELNYDDDEINNFYNDELMYSTDDIKLLITQYYN